MSRIIIDNQADLPDVTALQYVITVIRGGRVSDDGQCYCYASTFLDGVVVYASRNKASDRFVVRRAA